MAGMILRSVSLFLASGRRASSQRSKQQQRQQHVKNSRGSNRAMPHGSSRLHKLTPRMMDVLRRRTHFNRSELEALHQMFCRLVGDQIGMDRSTFRSVLHSALELVTEEPLSERLWCVWESCWSSCPGSSSSLIQLEPWLAGLSTVLRGSLQERVIFCFRVYDLNADGHITKEEMFTLLKNSLLKQPGDEDPEESARELSELLMRKLDSDGDGKVSLQDYILAVKKENLLLEAAGQCLPTAQACSSFLEALHA